ncbi:MAG: hypothetical protein WC521_04770 [Bdellovibrionales bacterium]
MTAVSDEEFKLAFTDWYGTQNVGRNAFRDAQKALTSKYYLVRIIQARWLWDARFDNVMPEKIKACYVKAHNIPLSRDDLRENEFDYWPEMRWVTDKMLSDWAYDPRELVAINQSELKQTLSTLSSYYGAKLSMITYDEVKELHKMALELRVDLSKAQSISAKIRLNNESRQKDLREQIFDICDPSLAPHRDYFLNYFGFSDAKARKAGL